MLATGIVVLTIALGASTAGAEPAQHASAQTCKQAKSSANYECNVVGSFELNNFINGPYTSQPIKVASVEQCAYYCSRTALHPRTTQYSGNYYCASFEFDPHLKACQLFNRNVSSVLGTETNYRTKRIYNDLQCFNCGDQFCDTPSGQPYGTQLLDNGDFENQYALGLWNAANVDVVSRARNTYVEVVGTKAVNYGDIGLFQYFNVCPHQYYELMFDYTYTSAGEFGSYLGPEISTYGDTITVFDGWGIGLGQKTLKNGLQGQARYIFQPPRPYYTSDHSIRFRIDPGGKNWNFTLDNVAIVRRPPPSFTPSSGSVSPVPNGGFESGKIAPWNISDNYSYNISSPGLSGSNYALYLSLYPSSSPSLLRGGKFATRPKTYHLMSVEIANGNPQPNKKIRFQIEFYVISDGAVTSHTFPFEVLRDTTDTTRFSWPMWSYGKSAQVVVQTYLDYFKTTASDIVFIVDNIRMNKM